MKNFRQLLIGIALALIVVGASYIDYNTLSWEQNSGTYLVIFSMIMVIISMILSNRYDRKKEKEQQKT